MLIGRWLLSARCDQPDGASQPEVNGAAPLRPATRPVAGSQEKHEAAHRSDTGPGDDERQRAMHLQIVREELAFLAEAWNSDPRLDKATIHALACDLLRRSL